MFVQHKQLKSLNVAPEKVARLHAASSSVQLAFSGFAPQLCSAYLLQVTGGDKALIVVAFHLIDSRCSIFFVPKCGEVNSSEADRVYEEGYNFVESMGFVLTETDYHLFPANKKIPYWTSLPICRPPAQKSSSVKESGGQADKSAVSDQEVKKAVNAGRASLGRFLASL